MHLTLCKLQLSLKEKNNSWQRPSVFSVVQAQQVADEFFSPKGQKVNLLGFYNQETRSGFTLSVPAHHGRSVALFPYKTFPCFSDMKIRPPENSLKFLPSSPLQHCL